MSWVLIQFIWCPYKNGKFELKDEPAHKRMPQKTKAAVQAKKSELTSKAAAAKETGLGGANTADTLILKF